MLISKIHLYNWLSHADTAFELERVTAIRGENGSGKTSVQAALEYAFAARSVHTDDKGSGAKEVIRRGAPKPAAVTIDLTDEKRPIRMRCSLSEASGRAIQIKDPSDASWTGSEYLSMLAAKREVLDCLINGAYFMKMEPARQMNFLSAMLLPATIDIEGWAKEALHQCGITVDWSLRAFDLIKSAHTKAFDERTIVNRLLKGTPEPVPPQEGGEPVAAIKERLATRQAQRDTAAGQRSELLAIFNAQKSERHTLTASLSSLQGRLTEELQRKRDLGKDTLSKTALKEKQAIAANAERAKALDGEIAGVTAALGTVKGTIKRLDEISENPTCPTCFQVITEDGFARVSAPLIQEQDSLLARERELQQQRRTLGDYEGAARNIQAHEAAERSLTLVQKHVEEVEQDINGVKSKIEALGAPAESPDTAALDTLLADIDKRLQTGKAALEAATRAEEQRVSHEKRAADWQALNAKLELLEKLIEHFGPKGLQATLLGEHAGAFEQGMNKFLAAWGFECHLAFDPYSFRVRFLSGKETFDLRVLSDGQSAMFGVAFQVALAKTTGFNFVCVDAAEVFSDENRKSLFKALIADEAIQAIVIAADTRREIPNRPGTAFYMFSLDGAGAVPTTKVERLKYVSSMP